MLIPATDLSEQISLAGTEASGTGNMKFALNGALTIGTWDGANIEIFERVGDENYFSFGLSAKDARNLRAAGYDPGRINEEDQELKQAVTMIGMGYFSGGDSSLFRPVLDAVFQNGTDT